MTDDELTERILAAGDINRDASVTFGEVAEAIAKIAESLRRASLDASELFEALSDADFPEARQAE